jgi:hypothetical protein
MAVGVRWCDDAFTNLWRIVDKRKETRDEVK